MNKRTRARALAMQALYQLDIQGEDLLGRLENFFTENEGDVSVCRLALEWTRGSWENLAHCDEFISGSTIKWNISRLSYVDKAILRLSVYQLIFVEEVPPRVVIDEAIELAKRYSTSQSPSFVNGVLDAILKKVKQGRDL